MGAARVWVELGPGDLVRADIIVKIHASGEHALSVKVTGEREPRVVNLEIPGPYPPSWTAETIERFQRELDPVDLAWGLSSAIAEASEENAGMEVRLCVEPPVFATRWVVCHASGHNYRRGTSFWDFSFDAVKPTTPALEFPPGPTPDSWVKPRPKVDP